MPTDNPWDAFPTVGQPQNTGPIYGPAPVAKPQTPNPGVGYQMGPDGRAAPIPGGPADPNANMVDTPGDVTKTGDAYLSTLSPALAGQVKALAEGRRAFPTGTALKDPKIQELISAASQYDPTLDATNAATRVNTRKDFTSGKSAQNMTAINTAIGHLGTLSEKASQLGNRAFPLWNSVANAAETAVGDPRVKDFGIARDAVANELMRVFRQTGASTSEIKDWQDAISSSDSPDQLKAEIQTAVELLNSRLENMQQQYQQGLGKSADVYQFLSPKSKQILDKLSPGIVPGGDVPPAAPPPSVGGPDGGPPPTPWDNGAPQQAVATGKTRDVTDPKVAAGLNAMVQQGKSYDEAAAYLRSNGFQAPDPGQYAAALKWQEAHPNSPYNAANPHRTEDTTFMNRLSGSPLGAAGIAAGDAASAYTLDNIIGATGGDAANARQAIQDAEALHPTASMMGTLAGGITTALGGEGLIGRAGVSGAARTLAADTAYGAASGAGAADGSNRLAGAVKGAVAGAGGSYVGGKVGNALAKGASGVADKAVNVLRDNGVNALTVGQTFANSGRVGAAIKGIEDRLSGLPVVGDMVNARRVEGYKQFNAKSFDKALEPIGETVAGQTGENAIQTAQDKVSAAFKKALDGKGATPDKVFARDLAQSVTQAANLKGIGPGLKDDLAAIFEPYAGDQMLSGEALDQISRNLRELKNRYARSTDAVQSSPRVGKAIDSVERSVFDLFDRQASGAIPEYRAARKAYRRVSILEDAVNKARNQKDRIFTPAQLGMADRANAKKFTGKRQAAAGNTPFYDLQTAAQDVLPSKVPDSGTAGRMLIPLALVGTGEGADHAGAGGAGLTLGTILALAYTKGGQRFLTKAGRGVDNQAIKDFLAKNSTQRALTASGAASGVALANP